MEKSRYQQNRKLFLIGMIVMVLGLFSVGIALYLIPFVIFNNISGIPLFVFEFLNWLQDNYAVEPSNGAWWIWGAFIGFAVICFLVAEYASNHIDNKLLEINPEDLELPIDPEKRQKSRESRKNFLIVFMAIGFILTCFKILDWVLSSQPQQIQ